MRLYLLIINFLIVDVLDMDTQECRCIMVYLLAAFAKSKADFPSTYRDFICDYGAPSALRWDNALEEQRESVSAIHCEIYIKDEWSEPYH